MHRKRTIAIVATALLLFTGGLRVLNDRFAIHGDKNIQFIDNQGVKASNSGQANRRRRIPQGLAAKAI